MKEYTNECIDIFDEVMKKANTLAKQNLFNVEDIEKMNEDRMEIFYHIVAKFLYLSKRARVDIDLTVPFLCTRVSRSTEEDWAKLRRLLDYLWYIIHMTMIIGKMVDIMILMGILHMRFNKI